MKSSRAWWVAWIVVCGCSSSPSGDVASSSAASAGSTVTVGVGGGGSGSGTGGGGGSGGGSAFECIPQPDSGFQLLWATHLETDLGPHELAVDSSGNTFINGSGLFLRKYSATGELLWSVPSWQAPGTSDSTTWYYLSVGPSGRIMNIGIECDVQTPPNCHAKRVLVEETGDPTNPLKELWSDSPTTMPRTSFCPNGDIVAIGDTEVTAMTDTKVPLWTAPAPEWGLDGCMALIECDSQNRASVAHHCPDNTAYQLGPDGAPLWSLALPFPDSKYRDLHAFTLGPDDSLHAGGFGVHSVLPDTFWLSRVSADGTALWEQEFSYPDDDWTDNEIYELAALPSGDVWVAGQFSPGRSFLRGYSADGTFSKETMADFCSSDPLFIGHIHSDHAGGLRLLSVNRWLYAIKP